MAPEEKARAQKEVAISVVARNIRLNDRQPGMVSAEDVAKAEGDLKVAEAQIKEAQENRGIAEAELDLAKRTLDEHTIVAPFDGIVLSRKKNPGESVRANEAVIELGDLSRLSADAYVPLDYAYRVKAGPGRRDPAAPLGRRARRAAADREETIPRQDHLRRPADPASRRDGRADPGRVREPGRPAAGSHGADDDLPADRTSRPPDPEPRRADPDGACPQ